LELENGRRRAILERVEHFLLRALRDVTTTPVAVRKR
jgi:hypothetical protein